MTNPLDQLFLEANKLAKRRKKKKKKRVSNKLKATKSNLLHFEQVYEQDRYAQIKTGTFEAVHRTAYIDLCFCPICCKQTEVINKLHLVRKHTVVEDTFQIEPIRSLGMWEFYKHLPINLREKSDTQICVSCIRKEQSNDR